jgi:hypothetical protein
VFNLQDAGGISDLERKFVEKARKISSWGLDYILFETRAGSGVI